MPLEDGMLLAFGGEHFAYRVSISKAAEASTRPRPGAGEQRDRRQRDSAEQPRHAERRPDAAGDKTTFVVAPTSFLDIFCADEEPNESAEPTQPALPAVARQGARQAQSARTRRGAVVRARGRVFAGAEHDGAQAQLVEGRGGGRRAGWAAALALYMWGASERELKELVARGEYAQAAALANRSLEQRPDDAELKALATEAALKANVPAWLTKMAGARLRRRQGRARRPVGARHPQSRAAPAGRRARMAGQSRTPGQRSRRAGRADPHLRRRRQHRRADRPVERRHARAPARAGPDRLVRAAVRRALCRGADPPAQAAKRRHRVPGGHRAPEGQHRRGAEPRRPAGAGRGAEGNRGEVSRPRRAGQRAPGPGALHRDQKRSARPQVRAPVRAAAQGALHDAAVPGRLSRTGGRRGSFLGDDLVRQYAAATQPWKEGNAAESLAALQKIATGPWAEALAGEAGAQAGGRGAVRGAAAVARGERLRGAAAGVSRIARSRARTFTSRAPPRPTWSRKRTRRSRVRRRP